MGKRKRRRLQGGGGQPSPTPKPQYEDRDHIGDAPDIQRILPPQDYTSTWSSPEAFARHIKAHSENDAWDNSAWEKDCDEDSWRGTRTMEDAIYLMENGWKEGIELIERVRSQVLAQNPLRTKQIKYDLVGSVPSVPRAVAGDPKNMRTDASAISRRRPVITLLCNMAANCGVSAKAISHRAAAVAAVIDEIEAAGYSCEVISTAISEGYGASKVEGRKAFQAATSIVVKQSGQPVDLTKLAFSLGHAAMFRRMIFADWEVAPSCRNGLGFSLGHSHNNWGEGLKEKNIYAIPSAEGNADKFKTPETTADVGIKFIVNELRKQGCPAFPKWEEEDEVSQQEQPKKKKLPIPIPL